MLIADLLRAQAHDAGERTAFQLDRGGSLSFAGWDEQSNRLGRELSGVGLEPGERVGLLMSGDGALEYVVGYMAIHKAGLVAVPLNPRLKTTELGAIADHCGLAGLLFDDASKSSAGGLVERLGGARVALGGADLAGARQGGDATEFQQPRLPSDLADILYTSGTTGEPKGVACSHASVTFGDVGRMKRLAGGTFVHAVPLHTFAGTHAMMLLPLKAGMRQLALPRFDALRFCELLHSESANVAYAVPSMLLLMLPHLDGQSPPPALLAMMYGTAPMPPVAIARLSELLPTTRLINLYGLTEAGAAACSLPPGEALARPSSIGKPVPPTELRVVGDDGVEATPGSAGEIWMRVPAPPRSYLGDEAATAATWTDDGWLKTGDIGYADEDGYLYLVDRKKDLIIRGGFNISAPEVEGVLCACPGVLEVAVVGVEHPVLGEDTCAFVVLRDGESVSAQQLEAFARERLADFKVPRRYELVEALPRNALGKVLKRELREREQVSACAN